MSIDPSRPGPAAQRQIIQKRGEQARQKQSKYRNQPETRGSIRFDSKKEARRYEELMLLLKAGKIRNLKLQPEFTLSEAYTTPEGNRIRAVKYRADFSYERRVLLPVGSTILWETVVEDVKSRATKTRVYEIKKKLMRERFGIEITEVD